jgi:hypothetical protein
VNGEGKPASCHDFRRSFGTRWAKRVMPAVLQQLMRHASVETTLTYYVALDTDELADELWAAHGEAGSEARVRSSCPQTAKQAVARSCRGRETVGRGHSGCR